MTGAAIIAAMLRDPELRAELVALFREAQPAPAPKEDPALLTAAQLARRLGVSVAHVRRLDPPCVIVGDSSTKRYDLATVRAWLAEREPAPTTPTSKGTRDDVDISGITAAGLRRSA